MKYEEAEASLRALPHIEQAAIMLHGTVDQQLVAYLVAGPGHTVDPAELGQRLSSRWPGITVPEVYVVLDGLPRTADGEVDRPALSSAVRGGRPGQHRAPRILSGSAAEIADIWRDVLGLDAVSLRDDLFDLGGHSLTITRMAVRIRSGMNIEVPLTVFYDTPTILGIASAVERARRPAAGMARLAR
jgi:acyl carrier protein